MPVEIFQLIFRVFVCACPTVTSSIFGKSFHFPFPYFVLSRYLVVTWQGAPSISVIWYCNLKKTSFNDDFWHTE